jgi:enamine deaminase RidA (YjgF/YER057c/UK114 family)
MQRACQQSRRRERNDITTPVRITVQQVVAAPALRVVDAYRLLICSNYQQRLSRVARSSCRGSMRLAQAHSPSDESNALWEDTVTKLKHIAPVRIGGTDLHYAQGVRAGHWLFFTGHLASDFEHGLAAAVTGKVGLPLGGAPRYRRESDYILQRLQELIAAVGGDLRHIVRVDQYYPTHLAVNPYQRARKSILGDYVPPSTSVLMDELSVVGANMDVSLLAVLPGEGREPKPARAEGVPVPQHSGFIPSLMSGDYVFVAGQMPNNDAMTGLAPAAYRAPNAVWNGTDIRLQTEFLITSRLKPALEAGGSSLQNAIKAQVYLTNIQDLPEFLDVWNSHFGENNPCALTVVATKGLALLESIIEINIFGVRDAGKVKKEVIAHKASQHMRLGPAAVRAGDLLCLSGLFPADENGAVPAALASGGLRHYGAPAQHQMRAILDAAADICKQAGTSLENVVRAHHFVSDLALLYPALRMWQQRLGDMPIPFGAVRPPTPFPIPGCDIILDLWVYAPK